MNSSEPLTFVGGFYWRILWQYLRQHKNTAKAHVLRSAVIPAQAGIQTIDFVPNEGYL